MIPISSGNDGHSLLRDEIIAGDVMRDLIIEGDDPVRLLQGTTEPVVAVVASEPSVSVIAVTQKTEIMHFDRLPACLVIRDSFHPVF
jgi:hypothetical protein